MDVHAEFQLLFEQLHVLKSIYSVRRTEILTCSAKTQYYTPNHLARQVFHCGYNISRVKTLTQWPPNVHMTRYKLLHGIVSSTQRESKGDDVLQSPVSGVRCDCVYPSPCTLFLFFLFFVPFEPLLKTIPPLALM